LPQHPRIEAGRDSDTAPAGQDDLDVGGRSLVVIGYDSDLHEGGGGIALLQFTPPGVEAGLCKMVASAEGPDCEATVLSELDPASPMLLFARIARLAVGHDDALLSETI